MAAEARRPVLEIEGIEAYYGPIQALSGVDVVVHEGEIVTLIGANGAGKSTLLMTICGNPRGSGGRIVFDGRDITALPTHVIARLGVAHVPEGRRIFPRMTVLENLLLGTVSSTSARPEDDLAEVFGLFPVLGERQGQRGGTLSGGEQQMLAIARALMSRPKLLLLDEPSLGLAPLVVRQIFDVLREIHETRQITTFLVEQNAYHALGLADRAYVMVGGTIQMQGTGAELLADADIRATYLEGGHG